MKYLIATGLSGLLFLGMHGTTYTSNYWHKVLFNNEDTKEKKKKEFKINTILWAIGTVIIFVVAVFNEF